MECTLTEFIKGKTVEEFIQICVSLQDCLEEFHQSGYLHLDIKPDNFIVINGKIKIIKFERCKKFMSNDGKLIKTENN